MRSQVSVLVGLSFFVLLVLVIMSEGHVFIIIIIVVVVEEHCLRSQSRPGRLLATGQTEQGH